MTFGRLMLILRARWLMATAIFATAIASAVALTIVLPKQYMAYASVVVDAKSDPVAGVMYPEQLQSNYIATQVDIISSERVAQRVVKILKLDQIAEFRRQWQQSTGGRGQLEDWLARNLENRLSVIPSHESNVITISVKWPDAKASAALANAFAQAYIDTNIELKVDPAKQYASWFDERSKALRTDLEVKQKRLSDYQNATGIIATDERLDIENARLNELSTELVTIQAQRQDSQSRERQVSGDNESLPEVLQSPLISSLKADLSRAESQQQDIATRLGKNHPDYQTTAAEIGALRSKIRQESDKIANSLATTTQINLRRENDIRTALEAQKKRMLDLKHQHDQAAVLENDVLTAQRNLDAVTQRLAQTSLESQTQQANIVLLTPAVEPIEPSSPKLLSNVALGLFFGVIFGVGAAVLCESFDRRVRSDDDLQEAIGIPLLGRIGYIEFRTPEVHSVPAITSRSAASSI